MSTNQMIRCKSADGEGVWVKQADFDAEDSTWKQFGAKPEVRQGGAPEPEPEPKAKPKG